MGRAVMTLRRQGLVFLLVGIAQLVVDWLLFVSSTSLGVPVGMGNVLGRIGGACLGFWLNGRYTFARENQPQNYRRALVRFGVLWVATTVVSTVAVSFLAGASGLKTAWAAKPAVEAVLALVGFFVSRHWVYRP